MPNSQQPSLFSDFAPVSLETWQAKVEQDLKGKPFDRLIWQTPDGIALQPMYVRENQTLASEVPGKSPFRRGSVFHADEPGWQIVQPVMAGPEASSRIQEAVQAEVGAILLEGDLSDLPELLGQADLGQTAVHLVPDSQANTAMAGIRSMISTSSTPDSHLTGTMLRDVVMTAAMAGRTVADSEWEDLKEVLLIAKDFPYFRGLGIDLRAAGEAGATPALQLALALSAIAEYMDKGSALHDELSASTLAENLHIVMPVSGSFFLEAGKFRALRMLVATLLEAYQVEGEGLLSPFVTARSARRNLTRYDQYNNLLRHTTEAMSAIVGGAEAVALEPFNVLEESNSKTGSRLARNIQFLLKHESYLDQVQDVGGGSYYLETITEELAHSAWQQFLSIEQAGGLLAFASNGQLASLLEAQAAEAKRKFDKRSNALIGVNLSPNSGETRELEITEDDLRMAAGFEKLRAGVDQKGRELGKRLSAYLWQFGDIRMRNARAQFSRDLLAAAGLDILDNPAPDDLAASTQALKEARPDVVVLCSSDDEYVGTGKEITAVVQEALPEARVIVAGKVDTLKEIGADEMIFAGMNALAFLTELVE